MPLAFTDQGAGRTFLLLHGGAGPASLFGLAAALSKNARVIVPTHPGFNGEPRPERFMRVDDLVLAYLAFIEKLNLNDVILIGNSVGGWICAEIALRQSPRLAGMVLLDAVGIDTGSAEKEIVDPMKLPLPEMLRLSFHNPQKFAVPPSSPEAAAVMANNQRTLRVYAGEPFMHEPTLRSRLPQMKIPTMVIWGESDRIVDVGYGRLYANSIPDARFEVVSEAAHFPHIERLDQVVQLVNDFTAAL